MEKLRNSIIYGIIIWIIVFAPGCANNSIPADKQSDDTQPIVSSRRTGINLPNGDILHEVADKNVSSTNGVMSIDIDTLETVVELDSGIFLRNNTTKNILEVSYDGVRWEELGASAGEGGNIAEIRYEWQVYGAVIAEDAADLSRYVMLPGDITSVELFLGDTGTAGDDLLADVLVDGVSIYTGGGAQPEITVNSGSNQVDISNDAVDNEVETGDLLTINIDTAPDDAEDLRVVAVQKVETSPVSLTAYQWVISGAIVTGVLDLPRYVTRTGRLSEFGCVLGDTGTSGSNFVADVLVDGTSAYTGGGTKPEILVNSGSDQSDVSTSFGIATVQTGDILTFDVDSAPDDASDAVCTVYQVTPETNYAMYTWSVSGSVVAPYTSIDVSRLIHYDGLLVAVSAVLEDTGTGGDDLLIDVNVDGTSIYTGGGTQPTISANSGLRQADISTDMDTTIVSQWGIVSIDIDTAPDDAEGLTVQIIQQLLH